MPGTGATASISHPGVAGRRVGAHHRDREARRPGQLLLEGPLEPGQPELVPLGVLRAPAVLRDLLDHLGGRVAHPPEQRDGEPGRGGEQPGRGREHRTRADRRPGRGSSRNPAAGGRSRGRTGRAWPSAHRRRSSAAVRRRRERRGQRRQIGHLGGVDADVDHLGRREHRGPRGVGDRRRGRGGCGRARGAAPSPARGARPWARRRPASRRRPRAGRAMRRRSSPAPP